MAQPRGSTAVAAALEQEIANLYAAEAPAMLRYAAMLAGNPETARDALQEAFFRFFIARRAGRQFLSPKAWLFRVARNYILDHKRSFARNEIGIESALDVACPTPDPAAAFTNAGLLQRASQIGLSAREIECFRLRGEGLRYEEIATVLGVQCGTVGALLARAHGKFRQALGEEGRQSIGFALAAPREKRYAS